MTYLKVNRNPSPCFDSWYLDVEPHILALRDLDDHHMWLACEFMKAAIENRNHEAKLGTETVTNLITWAIRHKGFVQHGLRAILTEPINPGP